VSNPRPDHPTPQPVDDADDGGLSLCFEGTPLAPPVPSEDAERQPLLGAPPCPTQTTRPRPPRARWPAPEPAEPLAPASTLRDGWKALALGAVVAPLFGALPLFGWFLGALCHGLGHTTVALLSGRPAVPRIRPTGEALTTYSDPSLFLSLFVPALVAWGLWKLFAGAWRTGILVALGLLLLGVHANPAAGKTLFLVGGHLGELTLAAVFVWRAWTGGFTSSGAERVLYAALGLYLVGCNLKLTLGLVFSEAFRAWYRGPGAAACENDYVRLSRDLLGWELESVALLMTLPALVTVPVALWLGLPTRRARG